MRLDALLREAWTSAWASKVPTILIILVTAAMCFTTSATAGRNAALQSQLNSRIADAGAKVITATDTGNDGFLTRTAVDSLAALDTVDTMIVLTSPGTWTNEVFGWGGPTLTGHGVIGGGMASAVTLTSGRWPDAGEAIIADGALSTLRLAAPSGALVDKAQRTYSIVGSFTATGPFADLNDTALYPADEDAVGLEARLTVSDLSLLTPTERSLRRMLSPTNPSNLKLTSPRTLAGVGIEVGSDVSTAGYETTLVVLVSGALFTGAVSLADVLIRRRDLGRRRTLGITRGDLMALICLRTTSCALVGAALGLLVAQLAGIWLGGRAPLSHSIAAGVLVAVSALIATIPAGILAASRDPASVLRTP